MNTRITELPVNLTLTDEDVLLVDKAGSYTAKITVGALKEYILNDILNSISYYADGVSVSINTQNVISLKDGGVGVNKLDSELQDLFQMQGSTITGTLSTVNRNLTDNSNQYVIVDVKNSNNVLMKKAIKAWDVPL